MVPTYAPVSSWRVGIYAMHIWDGGLDATMLPSGMRDWSDSAVQGKLVVGVG